MSLSTIRHMEIFDPAPHQKTPIHIIGVGATGSRVYQSLVELGLTNIHVYDFDIVEPHNLANQIYTYADVGTSKVSSCAQAYKMKVGEQPPKSMTFNDMALPNPEVPPLAGIVFLLTDTMASRREIYENCLKENPRIRCVIETRMASSYGNIFMFEPFVDSDAEAWLKTLISDDAAEVSACGSSISVGPTANIIANMAVWQMIHFLTDQNAMDKNTSLFLKPFTLGNSPL